MNRIGSLITTVAVAASLIVFPTPANAAWNCPRPTGIVPQSNVAVLIHGWLGSEMTNEKPKLLEQLGVGWSVITFDYKTFNTAWPSSSSVAQCLSDFGQQAQSLTGRPDPSVYLVGHSMGGIMARFALNRENPDASTFAAGVVTIDTPHLGSPWGASGFSQSYEAMRSWWAKKDGAKCLALHHPGSLPPGCGYPPAIAEDVPLAQIAGNITLTRTWLTFGRQQADIMSDGIVWLDSQTGYKRSLDTPPTNSVESYTVRCAYSWGLLVGSVSQLTQLRNAGTPAVRWMTGETLSLMQSGTVAIAADRNAVAVLGAASLAAPCGHNVIPSDTEALAAAARYLKSWAQPASPRPRDGVSTIPDGATWLYDLPDNLRNAETLRSDLPVLIGDETVSFPNSTGLLTRCGYPQNTIQRFDTSKEFSRMSFAVALTDLVPSDVAVTVGIGMTPKDASGGYVPDAAINWTLRPGESVPRQELDITGMRDVAVFVEPSAGIPCGTDEFNAEVAEMLDAYVQ